MKGEVSVLTVPKRGDKDTDNKDACWPVRHTGVTGPIVRLAMADGVAEASLSADWARAIVTAFGTWAPARAVREPTAFGQVLRPFTEGWNASLRGYVEREESRRDLPYYEKDKLREGAATTVLAVYLLDDGSWHAAALGDTCVFQIDDKYRRRAAFPLADPASFNSTPGMIRSLDDDWGRVLGRSEATTGRWERGERFFLASDALSLWLLREERAGRDPWRRLDEAVDAGAESPPLFRQWADGQRETRSMRNDDVSVIRLLLR
ncbi:hypothetical protein GCM10010191_52100 [Actinomadura vinacea]|uniref:PPM-type phosphatase domain-containing protein n=1 Tax=Actinomadura vinacea TaxID=115336 RepID=A0ABP5WRK1_9ACTN